MTSRLLRQRPIATDDFDVIVDYYLRQAGPALATRFSDALNDTFRAIARNPGAGSPVQGQRYGLLGLRTWPVKGFPHLVCYFDAPDHIDVWRILHGARDLGALFGDTPEDTG